MIYYIFIQAVEPSLSRSTLFLLAFAVLGAFVDPERRDHDEANVDRYITVDNDATSRMGQAWPFEAAAPRVITMLSLNRRKRTLFVEARGRKCTLHGPPEDSEVTGEKRHASSYFFLSPIVPASPCLSRGWFSRRVEDWSISRYVDEIFLSSFFFSEKERILLQRVLHARMCNYFSSQVHWMPFVSLDFEIANILG